MTGGGVTETTGEIMARQARLAGTGRPRTLDLFPGRAGTSRKKVDPEAALRRQGPAIGPQSPEIATGREPALPQAIGVTGDSPTAAVPCATPPDTMGAVGPTQFVVFENCNVVTYSKATGIADGVLDTDPDTFFASVRSASTSDPQVRYDRLSQRWFLLIIDTAFPDNRVLLAVSDTATITSTTLWRFFFFQTGIGAHTNCLADYPTPGIDANAIYVGVNQFCGPSFGGVDYVGSDVFVVRKSSVLGAGPIQVTGFASADWSTYPYTPHGVDNADPAATEGWLVGNDNFSWSQLDLIRVSNPGSASPTLSSPVAIPTANQGSPIPQPHLGNTGGTKGYIDAIDNRPMIATYRDGSLWTAMPVGVTVSGGRCVGTASDTGADRDAVFWWEIRGIPTGSTPSVRQAGIVCDVSLADPLFFSYGSIVPNGQGHAAAGFTIAGNATYISGGTAGRLGGDALSTLQAVNVYAPGIGAYNPAWDSGARDGYRRWGDYSFTSLDPCNDQTIWTIQEYVPAANQYGSKFAELKGPPPASPVSANPPLVAAGQSGVAVLVTGLSVSGSAFYDTPAGLSSEPCRTRLAAAFSGSGVTVTSVAFGSPTQALLNLSTAGAAAGARDVTVTNPDGQSAAGSGILTITSPCTPPATPAVTAPSIAGAGSPNRTASVTLHSGSTYDWSVVNGTITAGQGTSSITFTAGSEGTLTLYVSETNGSGCASALASAGVTVAPPGSALQFYTVTPCRVIDTRALSGFPSGYGPSSMLGAHAQRSFVLAGPCGIPADAKAISVNAAVWAPVTRGNLRAFPAGSATPTASMLNWEANIQALANAAILQLGTGGAITVQIDGPGTVDLILDVNGYFR